MVLYHILDWFFVILHTSIILFNLFGWLWPKTRKANLILLFLTAGSWFILGIFKGIGYCSFTDWHWKILHKLGIYDLPHSYITYLIYRISDFKPDDDLVNIATVICFVLALICSLYVNFKHRLIRKTKQGS